jgi:hypothetical protein
MFLQARGSCCREFSGTGGFKLPVRSVRLLNELDSATLDPETLLLEWTLSRLAPALEVGGPRAGYSSTSSVLWVEPSGLITGTALEPSGLCARKNNVCRDRGVARYYVFGHAAYICNMNRRLFFRSLILCCWGVTPGLQPPPLSCENSEKLVGISTCCSTTSECLYSFPTFSRYTWRRSRDAGKPRCLL